MGTAVRFSEEFPSELRGKVYRYCSFVSTEFMNETFSCNYSIFTLF